MSRRLPLRRLLNTPFPVTSQNERHVARSLPRLRRRIIRARADAWAERRRDCLQQRRLRSVLWLAGVLEFMSHWFELLRWVGVAYLLYLGVEALRAPVGNLAATRPQPKSARAIYTKGLLVSLTNPKTLLFFGAFLPQFVDPKGDALSQLSLLSLTFLMVCASVDVTWAVSAG